MSDIPSDQQIRSKAKNMSKELLYRTYPFPPLTSVRPQEIYLGYKFPRGIIF